MIKPGQIVQTPQGIGPGISLDAWGRPKVYLDKSLLHGMFTFGVPSSMWYEKLNGAELTAFSKATSVDGALSFKSGTTPGDVRMLRTFRHPRYEPNRGHLYSTSIFIPNPELDSIRDFGSFYEESGYFFRWQLGKLYACLQTTVGGVVQPVEAYEIVDFPSSYDPADEAGNTFDIQVQWRGVGDYYFYINDELCHTIKKLGTTTRLSIFNPATPLAFRTIYGSGAEAEIRCGCVDITTEGGAGDGKTYGSVATPGNTGSVAITGYNIPILAFRAKSTLASGRINTRDLMALVLSAYADQRCVVRVWSTRDPTAITLGTQTYADYDDGHCQYVYYAVGGTPMTFNTAKATLVFGSRVDMDVPFVSSAIFEEHAHIYQTPGDIFVFTMHRETGAAANVGVTYEFARSI